MLDLFFRSAARYAGRCLLPLVLWVGQPVYAQQAPAAPPVAQPRQTVIAVFGDGYAEALVEGLEAAAPPATSLLAETHAPAGLADGSGFDWPAAARAALARTRVDLAVVMLGANDRAALPDGATLAAPLSPRWRALYGERVQALLDTFRAARVPVVWLGLPVVADEAMAATFTTHNAAVRERVSAAGATYIDTWDAFTDENGRYEVFGPDAKGHLTRLRTADGFDLTQAGAAKLADLVAADLRARRASSGTEAAGANPAEVVLAQPDGFDEAVSIDINAQIRREAGLPALAGAPAPRARGPVLSLNMPALAPDGRLLTLASRPAPLLGTGEGSLAQRALVDGYPIPPRPGRVDDFAWPRP